MALGIENYYGSYTAQNLSERSTSGFVQNRERERTPAAAKHGNEKSKEAYVKELAKLVPSVEFRVGNTFSSFKNRKTLAISPALVEKMRNDPEQERETKELLKGVEFMTKMVDGIYKGSGWKVVFRHSYIDENGKFSSISRVKNEFGYKLSIKLRAERRKNSERLIRRIRQKAKAGSRLDMRV